MRNEPAFQFERTHRLHETRKTGGIINRLSPIRWRIYHDDRANRRTVEIVAPLIQELQQPTVVSIGACERGLLRLTLRGPSIPRLVVDLDHAGLAGASGRA